MVSRTSQLAAEVKKCPECGLFVRISTGELTWPIAPSLCKHGSWQKCPKLDLAEARRAARA
jgi:hypothetical protein